MLLTWDRLMPFHFILTSVGSFRSQLLGKINELILIRFRWCPLRKLQITWVGSAGENCFRIPPSPQYNTFLWLTNIFLWKVISPDTVTAVVGCPAIGGHCHTPKRVGRFPSPLSHTIPLLLRLPIFINGSNFYLRSLSFILRVQLTKVLKGFLLTYFMLL